MRADVRSRAYLNIVKDGHNEDIESGIPPTDDDAGMIRPADVRRPEHSHEPIMLYHDRLSERCRCVVRRAELRKTRGAAAVRELICLYPELEDATQPLALPSNSKFRVYSYQVCFFASEEEYGNENGQEQASQGSEALGSASLHQRD